MSETKRTKLIDFLRLAHGCFNIPFPNALIAATGEEEDAWNDSVANILAETGWTRKPYGGFTLSNASGMVFAHVRQSQSLIHLDETWYGGFIYAVPFPENLGEREEAIKERLPFATGNDVLIYEANMPGLEVSAIDARSMKVTTWNRADAKRHTTDFEDWVKVFEHLFDLLDFSERWGYGEQLFDAIHDQFWQWTALDERGIKDLLNQIARDAATEEGVRVMIRAGLGYPFDDIHVIKHKPLFGRHRGFFIEITSPVSGRMRISTTTAW